jgi:hypothetical protein
MDKEPDEPDEYFCADARPKLRRIRAKLAELRQLGALAQQCLAETVIQVAQAARGLEVATERVEYGELDILELECVGNGVWEEQMDKTKKVLEQLKGGIVLASRRHPNDAAKMRMHLLRPHTETAKPLDKELRELFEACEGAKCSCNDGPKIPVPVFIPMEKCSADLLKQSSLPMCYLKRRRVQ